LGMGGRGRKRGRMSCRVENRELVGEYTCSHSLYSLPPFDCLVS
jgi:hypothetical protein